MKKVQVGKAPKAVNTDVHIDKYKGKPQFQIYEINAEGENISDYPLINFGIVKARAVLKHMKELEKFVGENS